jgi:hypothetical protein
MTRFLVVHDYGQGGLWAYVDAASATEIEEAFREVSVVATAPQWLTSDLRAKLDVCDIANPTEWLATLRR